MSRIRRRGLAWEPDDGWLLDRLFVGVATLRTTRELFRRKAGRQRRPPRAWDLALWSGVTPQGSADALESLHRVGLVAWVPPFRPGDAASFRLDRGHLLAEPLADLFAAERAAVPHGPQRR